MKLCILEADAFCGPDLNPEILFSFCPHTISRHKPRPEEVAGLIGDSEGVLCSKVLFTRELMMACPKLRYIGVTATGYNNIDVAAARELGITVTNVPDYSSDAVAQMTFTFLLQFATGFSRYTASTAAGDWTRSPHFCYFPYPLTELKGKTLGLLGMGSIGKKVAAIGTAFGMEVIYCARTPKALPYEAVSPDKLLSRSDFLSLHCPLTEETREWINKESLAQMKSGAYLINTARGGLVNEEAVAEALKEGRLAGYGADVLTVEPQRADCPFIGVENCYLTPHVAWAPKETRERLLTVVAENLRAFLAGKPQNAV